jgi:hypothetical protein
MSNMVPLTGLSGHISDLTSKRMSPWRQESCATLAISSRERFGQQPVDNQITTGKDTCIEGPCTKLQRIFDFKEL